jgi:hypothetical protein
MTDVDFRLHDLGWRAFQQLCHTILRDVMNQTVVSFLDGNDGGRDGAFVGTWTAGANQTFAGEFVVQCKHTTRAGHNLTKSQLEDELLKAGNLARAGRCDVYVLMTNAGITGRSEAAINKALKAAGVKHVLLLGSPWINQTIRESPRVRRLVPRLYGLGDLTQILDERSYEQARAVLDSMRSDLAKLVLTQTYFDASHAVLTKGFVLLLGAPATGKTTIAAELALGAADENGAAVVKLDSIRDMKDRWNPNETQFFWLDDAFGSTQFYEPLAHAWTRATSLVTGAIDSGSSFVLTSRDYIFEAARRHLKPGSFPLLSESQVVIDVAKLTQDERHQILYNHLRHGRQLNKFLASARPHLDLAASHAGFTPELARRLADPAFTSKVAPARATSIDDFFARPKEFLHDVIAGLSQDGQAALGLLFINRNWLPSPIRLSATDTDLVERLGSSLGGVSAALQALNGSLVRSVVREGTAGWVFAHPTMVEGYAELLRTPELLHHLITGFPLDTLMSEVTCGDVGIQGALVVPSAHYGLVLDRLDEPFTTPEWWREQSKRSAFLAYRCDRACLEEWVRRDPSRLDSLAEPGLMLEVDVDNELVARLHEFGLFPEASRAHFAKRLAELCLTGEDPAVAWNDTLKSLLTPDEWTRLKARLRERIIKEPGALVRGCTEHWSSSGEDPSDAVGPLKSLVYRIDKVFPDDPEAVAAAGGLDSSIAEWVDQQYWTEPSSPVPRPTSTPAPHSPIGPTDRSVFDDLLDGR